MHVACLLVLGTLPVFAQEYTVTVLSRHVLTNESVVTLAKAGFDELFIVERIRTSRTNFDTSVEGLIALKRAGLDEDLIRVMALQNLRTRPTPIEAQPAGTVQTDKARVEKNWWGFRWVRVFTSRGRSIPR
jgi:hypothetical protein